MSGTAMIYARVSTKEQGDNYSLATQTELCRQHCERRGCRILGEFTDTHSGTVSDRPGMNALLDAIEVAKPDVVVLLDVDRLGRTDRVQVDLKDGLTAYGARIEFVNGGIISPDGDEDETMVDIKKLFAKQENRLRVERSRRGKRGRLQSDNPSPLPTGGKAPYGYDYVSEEKHKGEFRINEQEATVVRDIYHWLVIERVSSYEIAKRLYARGVPTRGDVSTTATKKAGHGEWSPTTIRRIVENTTYKGEWIWGKYRHTKRNGQRRRSLLPEKEWIKVSVPVIVDEATWEAAQPQLRENKANASRNTKREYLLRGMIFCTCGRRWTGRFKNNVGRAYYRCATTEAESWRCNCTARFSYRQKELEAAIWNQVAAYLLEPETMMVDIRRQREAQAGESAKRARQLAAIKKEIAATESKLAALLEHELSGYPKRVIEQQKETLLERYREFEEGRQRLEAEQRDVEITPDTEAMLMDLARTVRDALPMMTFADRRRVLELLRVRLDVIDNEHVKLSGVITGAIVDMRCSLLQ